MVKIGAFGQSDPPCLVSAPRGAESAPAATSHANRAGVRSGFGVAGDFVKRIQWLLAALPHRLPISGFSRVSARTCDTGISCSFHLKTSAPFGFNTRKHSANPRRSSSRQSPCSVPYRDVPGVVKSAGWMAAWRLVSGIGGLARGIYLGETKALEMSWPAPRTEAEELAAGAGRSAKVWSRAHGLVPCMVAATTGVEGRDGSARAAMSLGRSA